MSLKGIGKINVERLCIHLKRLKFWATLVSVEGRGEGEDHLTAISVDISGTQSLTQTLAYILI